MRGEPCEPMDRDIIDMYMPPHKSLRIYNVEWTAKWIRSSMWITVLEIEEEKNIQP